jgi:hypothetical protein
MVSRVFVAQLTATAPCRADTRHSVVSGVASFRGLGPEPARVAAASGGVSSRAARRLARPCTANGAPVPGAPSHGHVRPGYQACTFTAVVGRRWSAPLQLWRSCGHYSPATARLPRLVARGYPASVYGPSARVSFVLGPWRLWKACSVMDSLSQSFEPVACPQRARRWPRAGPRAAKMPSWLAFHRLCDATPGLLGMRKLARASCPVHLDGCACGPAA